jgi:hypothetical protein
MTDRCFAIFDEQVRKLKLVRMTEILPEPDPIIMLSPYTEGDIYGKVRIANSSEPEPMLKRIPLDADEHVYLWRSPWCMYVDRLKAWIPILDSTRREHIPGEYTYETEYTFYNPWYRTYKDLQLKMTKEAETIEQQYIAAMPLPVPSAPPSHKPPMFVAAIIKRDAIANRMACSISLEDFTEEMKTRVTPCFHIFEAVQFEKWVSVKGLCPTCKASLQQEDCLLL